MEELLIGGGILLLLLLGRKKTVTTLSNNGNNNNGSSSNNSGSSGNYSVTTSYKGGYSYTAQNQQIYGDLTTGNKTTTTTSTANRARIPASQIELYKGDLNKNYDSFYDYRDETSLAFIGYMEPGKYILPAEYAKGIRFRIVRKKIAISYSDYFEGVTTYLKRAKVSSNSYTNYSVKDVARFHDTYLYGFKFQLEILNPFEHPIVLKDFILKNVEYCYNELYPVDLNKMLTLNEKDGGIYKTLFDELTAKTAVSRYLNKRTSSPLNILYWDELPINPGTSFFNMQADNSTVGLGFCARPDAPRIQPTSSVANFKMNVSFKHDTYPNAIDASFGIMASGEPNVLKDKYWETQYWNGDWNYLTPLKEPLNSIWTDREWEE